MNKKILFIVLISLSGFAASAQQYAMYQASEASLAFSDHENNEDIKFQGALITLSYYSHKLEIKTALPFNKDFQESSPIHYPVLDLELNVAPDRMQRYLTSEKVFSTNGTLKLNNVTKTVPIHYSPLPFGTENNGQMRLSLIATFNISDFFPFDYPDEMIAFVINNGYVNSK
jgi:hypothetical protein